MGKKIILDPVRPKKSQEVRYRKALHALLKPIFMEVNQGLIPLIRKLQSEYQTDSWSDDLEQEFSLLRNIINEEQPLIPRVANLLVDSIITESNEDLKKTFTKKLGINVFLNNRRLEDITKARTNENISLIKSVGEGFLSDIETLVYEGATQGRRASEIAKDIRKKAGITERRANFIARDQVTTFYANINKQRALDLGVKEYIWRNMGDQRVRGNPNGKYPNSKYNHWTREGKIFTYKNPPPDGNAGEPAGCRCYAQLVIDLEDFGLSGD